MNVVEQLIGHIERGEHEAAQAIASTLSAGGHALGHVAQQAVNAARTGVAPAIIGAMLGGLPGAVIGGGLGRGAGGGRRRPPHPAYGAGGYVGCSIDPKSGMTQGPGEEFTFSSRLQFTGAQAVATDLGDFFTTAASDDMSANNKFDFDFEVDEARLIVGVTYSTAVAATGTELASILGMKLVERRYKQQEQYQLALPELAPIVYFNGALGTPTATAPAAVAAIFTVKPEESYTVWGRRYKNQEQWQLVARTNRAFTVPTNATLDLNLQLRGRRL